MIAALKKFPNSVGVLNLLIRKIGASVSPFTIARELQEHPDYPSLLAISDCLTSWKIANEAFRIDKQTCNVEELPFPFIAHVKVEGGQFILVKYINRSQVGFSNEQVSNGILNRQEFFKRWDGVVLYAEKDAESGEKAYLQSLIRGRLNQARLPFLALVILTGIVHSITNGSVATGYLIALLLKLAGIVVGALLLMHSIDANNPFIRNLCSLGKRNNCNAILKSNAARVTNWLTWSEVGMFYFAGSFICLLVYPESIQLLSWLNILCLPYTFYSIGYQIRIKNWCILCCSVQGILWLEAINFYVNGVSFNLSILSEEVFGLIGYSICFMFPIAIWAFIKPFMLNSGHVEPLKQQLKKFKYNSTLFHQLLGSQARYAVPDELMPIVLGNPNAETVITMVSNPFCGPCATAHKKLDDWISHRDDLQLKVLFTTANHDDDIKTKVARHVMALSLLPDKKIVEQALNDWYDQSSKDYNRWAARYPVGFNGEMAKVTEKQKAWCEMAEVSFTPTILINGYKLVDPYELDDIKYLLA